MLYLAIDQHCKQLTVNLRSEKGDVLLRRQVSTEWSKVREFFERLRGEAEPEGGFVAILEVCGFNCWLLKMLKEYGCRELVLVQPEKRANQKTDRRDAHKLGEVLWLNRERLLNGKSVEGVRVVHSPSTTDQECRQLTELWYRTTRTRTRAINRVHHLLHKHNLGQEMPTKGIQTQACRKWLQSLELPAMDRLEMDQLLEQWAQLNRTLARLDEELKKRANQHELAVLLRSIPGMSAFSSLALACRLSDGVQRFPRGGSLPNYWGLTPGCCNSGNDTHRQGSITKVGSRLARMVLGQIVLHVLRKDAWVRRRYREIKVRRGAKIARVAVMRRLAVVIRRMAVDKLPYVVGGPQAVDQQTAVCQALGRIPPKARSTGDPPSNRPGTQAARPAQATQTRHEKR